VEFGATTFKGVIAIVVVIAIKRPAVSKAVKAFNI